MQPLGKRKRIYAIGMCLTVSLSLHGWRACVCVYAYQMTLQAKLVTAMNHLTCIRIYTNMNWEWEKPSHCNHNARALNAQFNAQQNNWSRFLDSPSVWQISTACCWRSRWKYYILIQSVERCVCVRCWFLVLLLLSTGNFSLNEFLEEINFAVLSFCLIVFGHSKSNKHTHTATDQQDKWNRFQNCFFFLFCHLTQW